jgi:hypothetical protein
MMPSTDKPVSPPPVPQNTIRGALTLYSVVGVIFSIPLVGFGFTLTAGILAVLFMLQFPLFLLFGAYGMADKPAKELAEWDRWREQVTARR